MTSFHLYCQGFQIGRDCRNFYKQFLGLFEIELSFRVRFDEVMGVDNSDICRHFCFPLCT